MESFFPGTVVKRDGGRAKDFLFSVFRITKGLTLSQVCEITGLDTPTIQNWVNRGWVSRPVEKRYSIDKTARIIIINMLRDVMKLEQIAMLMTYINGLVEETNDDIIPESILYICISEILDMVSFETIMESKKLQKLIKDSLVEYNEPIKGARERLERALEIILIFYAASIVRNRGMVIFEKYIQQGGE